MRILMILHGMCKFNPLVYLEKILKPLMGYILHYVQLDFCLQHKNMYRYMYICKYVNPVSLCILCLSLPHITLGNGSTNYKCNFVCTITPVEILL